MLRITIPATEEWDEVNEQFIYAKEQTLCLEHSLVSLSKWESKWHKAFLSNKPKTDEEVLDYIKCMTITQNVPQDTYNRLTRANLEEINRYIEDPMTATVITEDRATARSREVITSEVIYHWMIALQIPPEYQKWHLNRLITLIKVCNIKNSPPKKRSARDIMSRNAKLNAARRKQLNSRG